MVYKLIDNKTDGFIVHDERGPVCHVDARDPNDDHKDHVVTWDPRPRAEWVVRSHGGTLTIGQIDAILSLLPADSTLPKE